MNRMERTDSITGSNWKGGGRDSVRSDVPRWGPGHRIRDDGIRELRPVLRHFGIRGLVSDALDQQALRRIIWDQHRSGVSALEQSVPKIHAQTTLLLLRSVTFVASVGRMRCSKKSSRSGGAGSAI